MIDLVRDALDCSRENAIFWLRRELAMSVPEKASGDPAIGVTARRRIEF